MYSERIQKEEKSKFSIIEKTRSYTETAAIYLEAYFLLLQEC
jgi:hypothetical protein